MEATTNDAVKFRCADCPKSFGKRMDYNRHRKQHDRPHKCLICGTGFALHSDLKRHQLSHLATRMLNCKIPRCQFKGTTRKDYLWKHMKHNHPKEKNLRQEYERIVAKSTPTDVGLDYLVAIGNEDVEKVGTLFQQHPNFQFSWSKSALHIAVEAGKAKSVNVLLTKGVIICTEDYDGHSALDVAARKNMVEIASLILKSVDNDEKRREMSSKALSHAVSWGHGEVAEVAELLIDAGVDVTKEVIGQPLLVLAARSKYHLIIKLLITKGADPTVTGKNGITPLGEAFRGYISTNDGDMVKTIQVLLEAGANVEGKVSNGWGVGARSLLSIALGAYYRGNRNLIVAKLLLEYGARINEEAWPLLPPELQEQYVHQRVSAQNEVVGLE